jgi:hypothetical protein
MMMVFEARLGIAIGKEILLIAPPKLFCGSCKAAAAKNS